MLAANPPAVIPQGRERLSSKSKHIPWSRIFAEGSVIVVSILLAFGIEAWWSNQQIQRDEQALLLELRTTLSEDLESLIEAEDTMIRVSEGLQDLILKLESGIEMNSVELDYQQALGAIDRFVVLTVRYAPFETLKARGLHLISNRSLRAQLTALYEDWIPRLVENSEIDQRLSRQRILPYMLEFLELDHQGNWTVRQRPQEAKSLGLTLARFRSETLENYYLPSFSTT